VIPHAATPTPVNTKNPIDSGVIDPSN